jgi:hypothetical protein
MFYLIVLVAGMVGGAVVTLAYLWDWRKKVQRQVRDADSKSREAQTAFVAATSREAELAGLIREAKTRQAQSADEIARARAAGAAEHGRLIDELNREQAAFRRNVISYEELRNENAILKRDLQNIDVNMIKLALDGELQEKRQSELDARSNQLAARYMSETVKSVVSSIGPSNFAACKRRLLEVIERCREIGFDVLPAEEAKLLAALKAEFEKAVRAEFERQEQARIKAQIREEEKLKREIDRELKQQERERLAIQAALDQAMAAAKGKFSAEVEGLKARLAEAEEKAKKTMSMAQQTKAGHVYIISNIGAFGLGVFKVGMTRRLVPSERVDELGSASVPFPFDVHMMISCRDAPALENALHRALRKHRINRANPRKEFFRVSIDDIRKLVLKHHGEVEYVADPEALEYNQSLTMPEEDAETIEAVYEKVENEQDAAAEEE